MSGLQGDVDVPVVGRTKKAYVAVAAGLVAGLVGYAYWRRRQDAATSSSLDAADGGLYVDTRTGSALPSDTFHNPAPDNADGQSGTGIGGDSIWQAPHTDQEWSQQAVDRLSWLEPGYVAMVVGKYLARQPVTTDEAGVIRELWGLIGHPPSNQPIIPVTSSTPAPTPTPKPAPKPGPVKMVAPTGLHATSATKTSIALNWAPVKDAIGYRLYVGAHQRGSTVLYSAGTVRDLHPDTTYILYVAAVFPGNKLGPKSKALRARTKK
jgi:hypothetical protein